MIKSIKILGYTYKIKWHKNLMKREGIYGECCYSSKTIRLQLPNKDISENEVLNTFFHEAMHMILHECGLDKINNEHHVVLLSAALHQALSFVSSDIKNKLLK
jgi:Zn-dependent peptidase ImmA (M78 family)